MYYLIWFSKQRKKRRPLILNLSDCSVSFCDWSLWHLLIEVLLNYIWDIEERLNICFVRVSMACGNSVVAKVTYHIMYYLVVMEYERVNILDWMNIESERTRHEKFRNCTNSCVTEVMYYVFNSYVSFGYTRETWALPLKNWVID